MIYRYDGPPSGVTLADGREVMLFCGQEADLPEDDEYTRALLAQRYLQPADRQLNQGETHAS